jgi:hypothetical protein
MIALRIAPYISSNGVRLAKSAPGTYKKILKRTLLVLLSSAFIQCACTWPLNFENLWGAVGRERRAAMETKYTAPNLRMPSRAELKANQKYKNKIK